MADSTGTILHRIFAGHWSKELLLSCRESHPSNHADPPRPSSRDRVCTSSILHILLKGPFVVQPVDKVTHAPAHSPFPSQEGDRSIAVDGSMDSVQSNNRRVLERDTCEVPLFALMLLIRAAIHIHPTGR